MSTVSTILGSAVTSSPAERAVLASLRELDVDRTTPLDALGELARLRQLLSDGEGTR